jgi:hypothetical protein
MKIQATQPTTKAVADWITDDVYVDPISQNQGLASPQPRPNPLRNPRRKVLQGRGGPLLGIRPGDIITTPPGEWHWPHTTTYLTHLALTEGDTE